MGKGHYLGGSTVVGPGRSWSDYADFPNAGGKDNSSPPLAKRKKAAVGVPRKAKKVVPIAIAPLAVPDTQARLIASILKDLGRSPPKKRNRLNNVLQKLMEEGVIGLDGEVNKGHPLIQEWFHKVDAREQKRASVRTSGL